MYIICYNAFLVIGFIQYTVSLFTVKVAVHRLRTSMNGDWNCCFTLHYAGFTKLEKMRQAATSLLVSLRELSFDDMLRLTGFSRVRRDIYLLHLIGEQV